MQNVNLNLIPGSVLPVINVSQYDVGRQFTLTVYEGAAAYSLTGKGVEIRGTKPDGNGFAYDSTDGAVSVSNNVVTITTLEQMTACGGQVMCELRITSSGVVLGTLNFIIDCEPSALSDDTPISDTDIPAIERDMQDQVDAAEESALEAEGYAVGTQDGAPVDPTSPYYENNAKWYSEHMVTPDLDDLANVNITTPTNGQTLIYDSINDKWVNGTGGGGGASTLDDLTDVDITTPTDGQVLKYDANSGKWINAAGGGGGTTVVQIPSVVVGTYTYTGSAQGPTITGLDAAHTVVTGDTATNVGSYTLTIALADPQTMVWSDLTTADKTYSWSIGKAPGAVTLSKNTVVLSDVVPSDTVTISGATGAVSISSSDTGVATVSPSTMSVPGGVLTVTGVGNGTATVTVSVAASSNYNATSVTISVTNSVIVNKIYGAVWDGSADTSWTRTDDAASFADPQPYYAGMSGTPSSPFDSIQPWAGMVRSTDADAGEVVAIPKFYYKLGYASGTTGLKIQIAPESNGAQWASDNGYHVSPAHMDRGDGVGERSVVYVGRYKCASDYISKTGVLPKENTAINSFRAYIHALGDDVWQFDFATRFTVWLLYLVEFADWDSQTKIGYGCAPTGQTSAIRNMGYTDTMPYHTGTDQTSRTTYGGTQYRYIEGLWDNALEWIDGSYSNSSGLKVILNPSNFSDSSGGITIGLPGNGLPTGVSVSDVANAFPAFVAIGSTGSVSTYLCDGWYYQSSNNRSVAGGFWAQEMTSGMFRFNGYNAVSSIGVGSRLMVLPSA